MAARPRNLRLTWVAQAGRRQGGRHRRLDLAAAEALRIMRAGWVWWLQAKSTTYQPGARLTKSWAGWRCRRVPVRTPMLEPDPSHPRIVGVSQPYRMSPNGRTSVSSDIALFRTRMEITT